MYQSMPVTRDLTSTLSRSSSFCNFCFSYRRLFIALRSSLLRIPLLCIAKKHVDFLACSIYHGKGR